MSKPATPPSAFRVAQAMSAAMQFREQLRAEIGDDHDALLMSLESETEVFDILRRVVRAAIEADTFEDALGERMKEMAERKARFGARSDAARNVAMSMLEALGETRFDDPEFTVTIGKPRQKVIVTDATQLPEAFVRVTRAPDMATINAAVKSGAVPAGVEVSNGAASLTIRKR